MTRRAPNKGSIFRPAPYEDIQCNAYLGRHRHNPQPDEIPVCQCQPLTEGGTGCAAECHNRYTNHECNPAYCPCGHNCRNQQIQRHQGAKTRFDCLVQTMPHNQSINHKYQLTLGCLMQVAAYGQQRMGSGCSTACCSWIFCH